MTDSEWITFSQASKPSVFLRVEHAIFFCTKWKSLNDKLIFNKTRVATSKQ
jgi:hypothetical protein